MLAVSSQVPGNVQRGVAVQGLIHREPACAASAGARAAERVKDTLESGPVLVIALSPSAANASAAPTRAHSDSQWRWEITAWEALAQWQPFMLGPVLFFFFFLFL